MMAEVVENVVTIPLEVADVIDRVFLPENPNKLRSRGSASPEVKAAAHAFREAVHKVRQRHALREAAQLNSHPHDQRQAL
jgi:hypothetical protein